MTDTPADHRLQGFKRDLTEAELETLRERLREAQRNGKITIIRQENP